MQIVIDKTLTNYQVFGDKKNTILILPGWKRSINEWIPTAKILSTEFRVVLLDLPGFSQMIRPKESFGVFDYAQFVKDFLLKLEIDKTTLIGHSFGGRLGVILAAETTLIEKLILVDSGGIEKKSLLINLSHFIIPFAKLLPSSIQNKIKKFIGSADYKEAGEMRDIFVKIVNQDLTHLFEKIKIPTFIIWGEKDNILPLSQSKIFKGKIKNSKLRVVWGAGHDPHLQKPEQFTSILEDIL